MNALRRFNEQHPRCPHCGAWAKWNGIEADCSNPRCNHGIPSAPRPRKRATRAGRQRIPATQTSIFDMEEENDDDTHPEN